MIENDAVIVLGDSHSIAVSAAIREAGGSRSVRDVMYLGVVMEAGPDWNFVKAGLTESLSANNRVVMVERGDLYLRHGVQTTFLTFERRLTDIHDIVKGKGAIFF